MDPENFYRKPGHSNPWFAADILVREEPDEDEDEDEDGDEEDDDDNKQDQDDDGDEGYSE